MRKLENLGAGHTGKNVPEPSIGAADSGKEPVSSIPGKPRGLDKSKAYLLALSVNSISKQAQVNSSREKTKPQERRVWTREREKFIPGARAREEAGSGFNNPPFSLQDRHLKSYRNFRQFRAREEARNSRSWVEVSASSPWSKSEKVACGVWSSRHSVAVRAFLV